ncbi:MAG TPA: PA14 domain-containing protein, partial [Candidatus Saccharimonadales bacterium]|nr:PA14 domain-containing protein [Candidatus Saccharimonadales bacterium]
MKPRRISGILFVSKKKLPWQRLSLLMLATVFVMSVLTPTASALWLDQLNTQNTLQPQSKSQGLASAATTSSINTNQPQVDSALANEKSNLDTLSDGQTRTNTAPKPATDYTNELAGQRTANSRTYQAADGSKMTKFFAQDANYKDGDSYKQLGNSVQEDTAYEETNRVAENWLERLLPGSPQPVGFKAQNGPLTAQFQTLRDGNGVTVGVGNDTVTLRPQNANDVKPEVTKGKDGEADAVTYKNVWDGVNLVYQYHGDSVKEYIAIQKPTTQTNFSFAVDGAVTLRQSTEVEGGIDVIKDGQAMFTLPKLSVTAAKLGPVQNSGVKYQLYGNTVSVSLSERWLASQPDDGYPIVVDPTIYPHSAVNYATSKMYSYKSDGYTCSLANCNMNVGQIQDNGTKYWRSLIHIPFNVNPGATVSQATIYLNKPGSYPGWTGTDAGARYWVTYAKCNGYNCIGDGAPWMPVNVDTQGSGDIKDLVNWMVAHGESGGDIFIHADDSAYKMFDPYNAAIAIYQNTPPPAPALVSPTHKSVITTTMPRLTGDFVNDADQDTVTYQISIFDGGTEVANSGQLDIPRWTVPEGILQDGGSYTWKVAATDSQGWSTWSGGWTFTVDLRTGKDKTQTYDDVGPLSANLATGNAYTSTSSHSIGALGGSIGIGLDYNTPAKTINGLDATYYNENNNGRFLAMTRHDPNIDYEWGNGSPKPGTVTSDNFTVNWTGYFIAPQTGSYTFGGINDDRYVFTLADANNSEIYRFDHTGTDSVWWHNTSVNLVAGQLYRVNSWFWEFGGAAKARLFVRLPNSAEQVVSNDMLRTAVSADNNDQGLSAKFYKDNDSSRTFKSDQAPFYVQTYSNVNINWNVNSPAPYDPSGQFSDNFLVRFSGYLTAPTTGDYKFGTGADDGQRLWVNNTKVVDNWTNHAYTENWAATTMHLVAGQVVPVVLEYYDATGVARVNLQWQGPAGNGVIDAKYLSTSYQSLPSGWSLSVDADGNLPYERVRVFGNRNVDLVDGDGTTHSYTWTGSGFKPPVNESGILTRNGDASYTLNDSDGRVYVFRADGPLQSVTTPTDDKHPAALKYDYQEQNGAPRLVKITDGVDDQRYGQVIYGGDAGCSAPTGFDPAPLGYVCAFKTYDGQITNIYYKNGQLSRVELPGGQYTDYGNDSYGRITSIRDSVANDAINASVRTADDSTTTQITYDLLGRLSAVKMPAANAGDTRQEHTFEYGYQTSKRHITGDVEPNGYQQYIEYDSLLRTTKVCDIAALCDTTTWDATKDLALSSTDETGLTSTTLYNYLDLPTDQYGPAPSAWYGSDRKPLAAYVAQVPHGSTSYDDGMQGLETSYYTYTTSSKSLTGTPKLHTTGLGQYADGRMQRYWLGSNPITPDTNPNSTTSWGVRSNGYIDLPQTGTYTFRIWSDDGVRLYIDDQVVIDDWKDGAARSHATGTFANTAAGKHRIRIEYYTANGSQSDAQIETYMTAPGGSEQLIAGSSLFPGYGLKTAETTYDSQLGDVTTTTNYGSSPELGLAQSTTLDPTGLNLTTSSTYEAPGSSTYLRQLSKTLPGGSTTSYDYYGATETRDNPCTSDVEAYRQAGQLKLKTEADPDGAGSQSGRSTETIYDDAGRVVATRINSDAWTCTSYDTRGRVATTVVPSLNLAKINPATGATGSTGTLSGRTITNNYAVDGNPLVTSTSDNNGTITVTNDLLGRNVKYVDAKGNITNSTYDEQGHISSRTSPLGTEVFTYDTYDRLTDQFLDNVNYAHVTYDAYSRIASVTYPGGQSLSSVSRDNLGRVSGLTYTLANGSTVSDSVTRATTGDIVSGTENGVAKSYSYDKAGRLTAATIGSNTYSYGFGTQAATCGVSPGNVNSGKSSNRTSQVINGANTTFCYDNADRLITSSDATLTNPSYDSHGNMTKIGTTNFTYDSSDRNTYISEGTKNTTFVRDV